MPFNQFNQNFILIYGQRAFLADLSVSKTHFTDKPAFFSDLSVNFGPLC
ncbi:hypothetical protein LRU_01995 [Ligilactobacillus ruminis SPM0211]|uniref:Uncharacterized protein n=1 Tax=Ligilactobacillus ruminis SPM0211 TaxID=1040964 RepID=F7R2P8_9LACO|nr:hypothetical protein LRU_01995 [Ligilactobacillus ruminis SPM0211]